MVDISNKVNKVVKMIEQGKYFTINRARQYGKTTMLNTIYESLKNQYYVLDISFENSKSLFDSDEIFCKGFCKRISKSLKFLKAPQNLIDILSNRFNEGNPFDELSDIITELCDTSDKEIILLIDEVDRSENERIFLGFLSMLRNKYLDRKKRRDSTFKSVILAGVYDIKNLKLKIRSEDEAVYNSPWNIATEFDIDMSFNPKEISTMLVDYEKDYHTDMNIEIISNEIYKFTNGYPFLVSKVCDIIHKKLNDWSIEGVQKAVKILINSENTLFDDIFKNVKNNQEFSNLVKRIILNGEKIPFIYYDDAIQLGTTFGILSKEETQDGNYIKISNTIFEILLYNIYISQNIRLGLQVNSKYERNQFIENNRLNMEKVILKFQEFMKCEYYDTRQSFIEDEGRLLFLCFLKPIINGTGFYYVEPQTRNTTRMDIVVTYGEEEHIIELKIWHGTKKHQQAYEQLLNYMDNRNQSTGYLVTFSFNKHKEYTSNWNNFDKKRIFEAIV